MIQNLIWPDRSLILKSCDRPIEAARNRLSACQYAARPQCFTHSLSLNFWPRCVCRSLTKRRPLSPVTTVDVVVSPVTLGLLVLSLLFACHHRSPAHTPDDVSQLLCGDKSSSVRLSLWLVYLRLPSQNYTPLPGNSANCWDLFRSSLPANNMRRCHSFIADIVWPSKKPSSVWAEISYMKESQLAGRYHTLL